MDKLGRSDQDAPGQATTMRGLILRDRLKDLLDLAQVYRGWSRQELARALGRKDPDKLVQTDNPKLDLIVQLGEVVNWPLDAIVAFVSDGELAVIEPRSRAVELARDAYAAARTPDERATACRREAAGWNGHHHAVAALQRGLGEPFLTLEIRLGLQSNLANAHYTDWALIEARSLASHLIRHYDEQPPVSHAARGTEAFAHYVGGNASRRLISTEPDRTRVHALEAHRDLERAVALHRELARSFSEEKYAAIANTCSGGLIEVEVDLGRIEPGRALEQLIGGLEDVVDPSKGSCADRLESYGWWGVFGCNVALRHITDEPLFQRSMAIFTEKTHEIAAILDNWGLRERILTMEFARHERLCRRAGRSIPLLLDDEDLRALLGTVAHIPSFRPTGMRMLRTATFVRDKS